MSPSRYAEGLRRALRRSEPERCSDLLLCGALIEARSHERFIGLVERLPEPLAAFYASLAAAEARHAGLYVQLAARGGVDVEPRLGGTCDGRGGARDLAGSGISVSFGDALLRRVLLADSTPRHRLRRRSLGEADSEPRTP